MRRAFLTSLAIVFAIACGDDITEPTPDRTAATRVTPQVSFATTTTEDGLSISTDKDDYQPGDVVHLTGSGWQAGDVLDIVLTDDPQTHDPRTWTVDVGADGMFHDQTYVVDEGDLFVAFTLTATSQATARSLTVQFTDNRNINAATVNGAATTTVAAGATITAGVTVLTTATGGGGADWFSTSWVYAATAPSGDFATPCANTTDRIAAGTFTEAFPTIAPTTPGTYNAYFIAWRTADCKNNASNIFVLPNAVVVSAPTTLTVAPAVGTEGGTASLSATLTLTSGGSGVNNRSISFTLNGSAVGSATTNSSGVATLAGVSLAGIAVGTYPTAIGASFAEAAGLGASSGTGSLTVTAKIILTGSFTVNNRPYDGNTSAVIASRALSGVVSGDVVNLAGGTATFDSKAVGTGKTVTGIGFTLTGADAGKYVLNSTTLTTTANITPVTLTGHFTADNKVYDGTTAATILTRTLTGGVISGDDVSLSGETATFANKTVGSGKTVTGTGFTLAGSDAGNYLLTSATLTTSADITARDLTVGATGQNKVYDGTADATVTLSDDRVDGDVFTAIYANANFNNKNVSDGKPVAVSGISISGPDAGNYNLTNTTATTSANITPVTLTGHFTADNKVYDGGTAATILTRTLTGGVISGDAVSLDGGTATFADKNAGIGKAVTGTGLSLIGADAGNYVLASTTLATTANITPKDLSVSATAQNKIYDGTTSATVTFTDDRLTGDEVTITYVANFNDKNVGNGKPVAVTSITLGGGDAGNYQLTSNTASSTANITPAQLTGAFTAANKVYDGTTAATILTRTLTGVVDGDDVSLTGGTANFPDQSAANGKVVTGTGFVLAGGDMGNYQLVSSTLTTTADITPRPVTVTVDAKSKFFGEPDPQLTYQLTSGTLVSGDAFTGALTREAGETVAGSPYAILQGSLTLGPNYDINFVGADLVIRAWTLTGFYAPVDMPGGQMMLNTVKGGQTVPLKFEVFVGSTERTDVGVVKSFVQTQVTCPTTPAIDEIEIVSTGGTVLRYDAAAGQFIQNWQTPRVAGKCYRVTMTTLDDSSVLAYFKTK